MRPFYMNKRVQCSVKSKVWTLGGEGSVRLEFPGLEFPGLEFPGLYVTLPPMACDLITISGSHQSLL